MSLYSSLTQVLAPFAAKINGLLTGWDGTRYNTPGEAVRQQIADLHVLIGDEPGTAISASAISYGENSNVDEALTTVNGRLQQYGEAIGMPTSVSGEAVTAYQYVPVVEGLTLEKGVQYTITAEAVDTPTSDIYCYLRDENNTALGNVKVNASTLENSFTYTPTDDIEGAILQIRITSVSGAGVTVRMSIADSSGENGIDKLRNRVTAVEGNVEKNTDGIARLDAFAGAVYPNKFRLKQDSGSEASNGVTVTFDNGRVTVNGTATAASYIKIGSVLPDVSEWLRFSGIPDGASASTYGIRWVSSQTTADHYEDWTITSPTAGSSYDIYLKFATGCVFDNLELELMAAHDYEGEFIAYGEGLILTTCAEMVESATDSVDAITGYTKPNLFNNTIYSRTNNGITYTLNSDKSVTMVGTATALSVSNAKCTLQPGTYILSGCADGGTETHHIMLKRAGGTAIYQYGGIERTFTVSETEEVTLYLRVVGGATVDTTVYPMIRPASVYNPTYAPYGEYQIYKPIQQLIDYTSFNWSGKKMNVIGDSIVYGSYGNFVNVIRDILCLSVARNYGIGGSCLASSEQDSQYPPAVLRYENMDTDAQIILVHAGTNDYSAQIPLGAEDSTDITTFNGALNVMMTGLREMYPTALIIFDSILHRYNDGALPIKAREYRACIESRCAANHILFYDCFKYSGFDFGKGYYDHILTGDGLHPNQIGANILGRKLAGFIRWN